MLLKDFCKVPIFGSIKVRYIPPIFTVLYNHYFFFDISKGDNECFTNFISDYGDCVVDEVYGENDTLVITIVGYEE